MHALTCEIRRDGRNTVVSLEGEVDATTRDLLIGVASPCITADATLTLDCSRVTFMDSRGVHAMVELRRLAEEGGARLIVLAPTSAVTRVLSLAGLTGFFTTKARSARS